MGCHTWVYANKKEVPRTKILMSSKEVEKELEKLELHYRMVNTIGDDIILFWLDYFEKSKYGLYQKLLDEYEKDNFGKHILDFYFYMTSYCGQILSDKDIKLFPQCYREYLNEFLFINRKEFETELFESYLHDFLFGLNDGIISEDNKYYWNQTEIHDPFRVYNNTDGYPTYEPFMNRESLEDFLFNDKLYLKTVNVYGDEYDEAVGEIISPNGLSYGGISPHEIVSQDLYEKEIKNRLDVIYQKYPDAIIQFG